MAKRPYERIAWEDRFNRPDADALRSGLHGPPRKNFDTLRKYLLQIDGVTESFAWYGESWRWSIEYRLPCESAATRSDSDPLLAVLIPSPEDLQLAMRIDPELARTLPMRHIKRAVRDGLDLAAEPFDTRWSVWSVTQPNMAEDLTNIIKRKADHMRKMATRGVRSSGSPGNSIPNS